MKILFLGYKECRLLDFLSQDNDIFQTSGKISLSEIEKIDPEIVISYGYKHILPKEIVEKLINKIINLHISYLPWNRGMYPNIWSIIDRTPSGVSIHFIDTGVDTGDIIFQKRVEIFEDDTLQSSYTRLRSEIEELFIQNWDKISSGNIRTLEKETAKGSYHSKRISEKFFNRIEIFNNWEMTVAEARKKSDEDIINEIQTIRAKNNTHWMDVVKLAFRLSPSEARDIFKKIKYCDFKINELLNELADNDSE